MKTSDAELRALVSRVSRAVASKLAAAGASNTPGPAARREVAEIVIGEVTAALAAGEPPVRTVVASGQRATSRGGEATVALARAELCASCIEQERRKSGRRAVVTTTGRNQKGIVAKIAQGIADAGGDILDISQTLVADYFTMIIVVDMADLAVPFAEFKARITSAVSSLGAECLVMHEEVVSALQRV